MRDLLSIGTNRRESMIGTGIGLGLAGYRLNPPGGPLPVLDLRFATDKSLTAFAGPTPSFSRASSGTYFDANGVLQSAGVNAARFNHVFNGTSWVSKGLLVEEQRTNVVLQSSFQSGWTGNSANLTANSASCPDGTNSAMLVVPSSGGSFRAAYQSISGVNCISVFAKASGKNHLGIVNAGGTAMAAWFNLSTGEVGTVVANYTATITSVGSGWYRCSLFSSLANYTIAQFCVTDANGSNSVTVNGSEGILLYGAQAESGSFSTSLIPTTTASTTRSADVCQITGSDFSGFWNGTEGSFAFEADALNPNSVASGQTVYSFDDGSSANSIYALRSGNTAGSDYLVLSYTSGVEKVNFSNPAGTWLVNVPFKNAIGFKLNDFAQSNNGGLVTTDTNCTMPIGVNQLSIGRLSYAGYPINGHIARLRYYRTRLENGTLRVLST